MKSFIDHLVITAPDLESGCDYVFQQLGVRPQPGGEHERMGTHNRLLKLSDTLYLEVIAVNPQSLPVGRPRWFELDNISDNVKPKLVTWVVRTTDIQAAAKESPVSLGNIEPMNRGDLNWFITIPEDGVMLMDGMMPTLIQWQTASHPASRLLDNNCSLITLEIFHPQSILLSNFLKAISFSGNVIIKSAETFKIVAHIQTAKGVCLLT
ncbi:MAG: VOC family protein [Sphingobacteriales bacterium]|nr:VOC family protein [Sphingobacteriales bacterium]MBI3718088.1 VOC family protein [Sphingobacteriales bacterium]